MATIKLVNEASFAVLLDTGWEPLALQGRSIPHEFGSNPDERYCAFIASGERSAAVTYESEWLPNCERVGGVFAYRRDEADHPFVINRDDYMLVRSRDSGRLFLEGSFADPVDHWARKIPNRYTKVQVVGASDNDEK